MQSRRNEGEQIPKVRKPEAPTQEEIDQHETTRMPFRAWCKARVKGRAATPAHRKVTKNTKLSKRKECSEDWKKKSGMN